MSGIKIFHSKERQHLEKCFKEWTDSVKPEILDAQYKYVVESGSEYFSVMVVYK